MSNFRAFTFSFVVLSILSTSAQSWAAGTSASSEGKPATLLRKSYAQMIEGEYRDAVDTQIQAVKADRDSINARRYLSYSLLKIGASDEAMQQLHNLLAMTKATPLDMCMCGEACLQSGRLGYAEAWFKEALAADPNMESARAGLKMVALAKAKPAVPAKDTTVQSEEDGTELAQREPKTTFEMGQTPAEEGVVAYTVKTAGSHDTASYASETARLLRINASNQQVASVSPTGAPPANKSLGNNQVTNAWENFKGIRVSK